MSARALLALALLGLASLYAAWFAPSADWVAVAVFVAPPLALATMAGAWPRAARFWSGVLALLWFSHGVMTAWSAPAVRAFALGEITLALLVVVAANWSGLRARAFRRRD